MNRHVTDRTRLLSACFIAAFVLVGSGVASAGPLGLTPGFPDIMVQDLEISYNAGTQQFTATGDALATYSGINGAGSPVPLTGLSYNLTATIDNAGNLVGPGSLNIQGDLGSGSQSLLAGNIFDFGWDDSGAASGLGAFEFLLSVTSSAPVFGFGPTAGVILATSGPSLPVNYSFNANFSGGGMSDNFSVPEPASMALLLLGAAGAAYRRRRT